MYTRIYIIHRNGVRGRREAQNSIGQISVDVKQTITTNSIAIHSFRIDL